ncbi:hypothetical protein WBG78_17410 [Chryseolinea sp. T2]|uniref:hypothetical protein n=1 Tax=Chryseolinea sp. T2 TaxID=3129255 RepID=UPI00307870C6
MDCSTSGPIVSLGTVVNATSCSIADGSIGVSASAGKEPYLFAINGLPAQADGSFKNLSAGAYTLSVTDANGCSSFVENVAIKASDFKFTTQLIGDSDCLGGNGQVTVNVEQLNPPYSYRLGTGSFGESNVFAALATGTYGITVKDNNGCSVNLSVTVPRAFSGVSWENDVRPIIVKSCALSGCHNGDSRSDLRVFDNAKFYAASIKSKTRDRSMPREGTLKQSEIDLISCWVDDGAVAN